MSDYIASFLETNNYYGIFLLMFLENIFPPIPSEFIMPLAGFMVEQGKLSFIGVAAAGTAGALCGTIPFYFLGRMIDEKRLKDLADRHGRWLTISSEDIEKAQKWFDRHGNATVLFCRLIPGVRSVISIPAGINRMNFAMFTIYTLIGSVVWTSLLTYLGFFLKSNFTKVEEYLSPVSYIIFGAVILIYLVRVIGHKSSKSKDKPT
jgi:membrane protein DedA with SNARE-associated domain